MLELVAQAFWFIAPAYAANAFPPLVRGKKPLDFGRCLGKNRLFGDGKTIEGSMAGIIFGLFIGSLQILSQDYIPKELNLNLIEMTIPLIFLLAFGAIVGDIAGAFIKRRFGLTRGYPAFPLDQLDFIAGAFLFSYFVISISLPNIVILIILTPIIHRIANFIGYKTRITRFPW